jgi:hypothetical protein
VRPLAKRRRAKFVCRIRPKRRTDDGATSGERTPRPPDVQRGNVPMPNGFLAPRVCGYALDWQVNFDEAFGILGHGDLAAKRRKRRKKGMDVRLTIVRLKSMDCRKTSIDCRWFTHGRLYDCGKTLNDWLTILENRLMIC